MRFSKRNRMGFGLTLGVLAGLGLILLPGILAVPTPTTSTTTTGSNSTVSGLTIAATRAPSTLNNQTNGSSYGIGSGIGPASVTVLVLLILVPAITLSFLSRAWAMRRARMVLHKNLETEASKM